MSDKNAIESLRELIQDFLVPELKAVKISIESVKTEMKINNDSLRQEMKIYHEASKQHTEVLVKSLAEKFDFNAEIRERMAALEARLPRQ